jgi:hypothetical protein
MIHFVLCFALVGCGAGALFDLKELGQRSTSDLWDVYRMNPMSVETMYAEAELGRRGAFSTGSFYLGKETAARVGKRSYQRPVLSAGLDLVNCSDFASSAEAQLHFLRSGGPARDPNNLDRDGDGYACEWGTKLKQTARTYRPKPRKVKTPSYRPSYSRTCHVGPRGGRYYYSSSGRKVYGC